MEMNEEYGRGEYKNGQKDGYWEYYHFDYVTIDYAGEYHNGACIGLWESYYDDGRLQCVGDTNDEYCEFGRQIREVFSNDDSANLNLHLISQINLN